ncbi:guanylate-binding protein 6-like [Loxodonta africana]|uniref:guanylate-binding protein 6-like n=1 Tax=Loxodonta africana TaxID=9785 RepID=UPI0030D4F5AF
MGKFLEAHCLPELIQTDVENLNKSITKEEIEKSTHAFSEGYPFNDCSFSNLAGNNPKIQNSNLPRECIRHFFPKWKCFVFNWPTSDKLLVHIEELSEEQLDYNFQVRAKNSSSYIFTHTKTKTLIQGIIVTGNWLRTLIGTYVGAINSGMVSCLGSAITTLPQHENLAAVQKAADPYSKQMAQCVRLPTALLQELLDVHVACEREATTLFMEHSFKNENQEF